MRQASDTNNLLATIVEKGHLSKAWDTRNSKVHIGHLTDG